jgi:hypothetical protein
VTRQAHAAHHVDLEETHPVGIRNFDECFWFENAYVIHQHIHFRKLRDDSLGPCGRSKISDYAFDPALPGVLANFSNRLVHTLRRTPIHVYTSAFACKRLRDRIANSGGGSSDKRAFSFELQIHGRPLEESIHFVGFMSKAKGFTCMVSFRCGLGYGLPHRLQ